MKGMRERLRAWADRLASSLWFIPGLLVLASMVLAAIMIWLDSTLGRLLLDRYPQLFGTGSEASRSMLSAIAQSMITVAGVTFSITIVAVAQASSQYTSRILRNFMNDRGNQLVLGVFLGIFTYCMVVIRTTRGLDEFVPALSTLCAFALANLGIGVLIYFIHHIAESLQAENLLARIAHDTVEVVDRLFPNHLSCAARPVHAQLPIHARWQPVTAQETGYIQSVDARNLHELAEQHDVLVRMERGVGDFVVEGEDLASLAGGSAPDASMTDELNGAYTIARRRTLHQDVAFGIRQLVDVAIKALSPGINDTTTAIVSIDHLSGVLARLAPRQIGLVPPVTREHFRVIPRDPSFESFVDSAFDEIRRNAAGNVNVLARLLHAVDVVAMFTDDTSRRSHLHTHVDRIAEVCARSVDAPLERSALQQSCKELHEQVDRNDAARATA